MSKEQQAPWYQGSLADRTQRIAADVGLDTLMRGRGYSAAQIDACLASSVAEAELMGMTSIGINADRVAGTQTFFVNGKRAAAGPCAELKTILAARSDERRVGQAGVSTSRSRGSPAYSRINRKKVYIKHIEFNRPNTIY